MADLGDRAEEFVILAADEGHEEVLLRLLLDADHDLMAFLPFPDKCRDEFGRILEIRVQPDHAVAVGLLEAVDRRPHRAEILGIENGLDAGIVRTQVADQLPGMIPGIIVDKNNFIVILREFLGEDLHQRLRHGADIVLLVQCRDDDRNELLFIFHILPP